MKAFETAKWIWINDNAGVNEYAEFCGSFKGEEGLTFRVSVDGDYALYINGAFVSSSQYGDFEHYKIYDEIALTNLQEENSFLLLVWHFGQDSQRYRKAKAGAIYEIFSKSEVVLQSDETSLCRLSPYYQSHAKKVITAQLGFSFCYDACATETPFYPATVVEKNTVFYPRPIKKSELLAPRFLTPYPCNEEGQVFDLGEEGVGLLSLSFECDSPETVTIAWGEDYPIRDKIDGRDFTVTYLAKAGKNEYTNPMLRFALRFVRVEGNVRNLRVALVPQVYPVTELDTPWLTGEDKRIYDICVNTLKLCMMEHYVDCPWREQCLYAFDSRNQMLCGYYAFVGGNFEYARANLLLMSKDIRDDKLMSICYPCGADLTIPSFSLYYILAVAEYLEYSGDLTLAAEVMDKMRELLDVFLSNTDNGLVCKFEGKNHWNFYDWSPLSEGNLFGEEDKIPDLTINALAVIALMKFEEICAKLKTEFPYVGVAEKIRTLSAVKFSANERGMLTMTEGKDEYTEISASLAVLAGIVQGEKAEYLCKQMEKGALVPCSLSMKTFKYEAYLKTDYKKYEEIVLKEIREDYGKMLAVGSSTVWETADGASAFDNAGSLCHGWSAIPVYYYHKLKK